MFLPEIVPDPVLNLPLLPTHAQISDHVVALPPAILFRHHVVDTWGWGCGLEVERMGDGLHVDSAELADVEMGWGRGGRDGRGREEG